jgi:hypothetical protein
MKRPWPIIAVAVPVSLLAFDAMDASYCSADAISPARDRNLEFAPPHPEY